MDLTLNHHSTTPLHSQIEEGLRAMIQSEPWASGERLPSETEWASRLGVSRGTLRLAIDRLVREGLLERRRRFGTRALPEGPRISDLAAWSSYTKEMNRQGIEVQTFESVFSHHTLNEEEARLLDLQAGDSCLALRRVRGHNHHPVVVMESLFHPRCGLTGEENLSRPLFEIIKECSGLEPDSSIEKLSAINAESPYTKWLGVRKGEALFRRRRETRSAGHRILELAINTYRGDEFTYSITLGRNP